MPTHDCNHEHYLRCNSAELEVYGRRYTKGEFLPFYVPREQMPQISRNDLPRMIAAAIEKGLGPQMLITHPLYLRAHQRVNKERADTMPLDNAMFPIIISSDNYIVDGNHRWWRHIHDKALGICVVRLGADFEEVCDWLNTQPYVTHSKPLENGYAERETGTTA